MPVKITNGKLKSLVILVFLIGLVITNYLTLTNGTFHNSLFNGLMKLPVLNRLNQNNSPTKLIEELEYTNNKLNKEIGILKQRNMELTNDVASENIKLNVAIKQINEKISKLGDVNTKNIEYRLGELEGRISYLENDNHGSDITKKGITQNIRSKISKIKPGIYVLEINDDNQLKSVSDNYVIYHLMTTVMTSDAEYNIQFGVGRQSYLHWTFYIDYNNDGIVDMDMIEHFAGSLPYSDVISGTFDTERSQATYDLFVHNIDNAKYIPSEKIANEANETSQNIWNFTQSHSERMASWIKSHLQ